MGRRSGSRRRALAAAKRAANPEPDPYSGMKIVTEEELAKLLQEAGW
jgi:hypothetical protein